MYLYFPYVDWINWFSASDFCFMCKYTDLCIHAYTCVYSCTYKYALTNLHNVCDWIWAILTIRILAIYLFTYWRIFRLCLFICNLSYFYLLYFFSLLSLVHYFPTVTSIHNVIHPYPAIFNLINFSLVSFILTLTSFFLDSFIRVITTGWS